MNKHFGTWVGTIAALFIFGGCNNIPIQNGEVPAEYVDKVKPVLGTYHGDFMLTHEPTHFAPGLELHTLNVAMEGRKLIVSTPLDLASLLLSRDCGSSIGELMSLSFNEEWKTYHAGFAFYPGVCGTLFDGRRLVITFKMDGAQVQDLKVDLYLAELQRGGSRYKASVQGTFKRDPLPF